VTAASFCLPGNTFKRLDPITSAGAYGKGVWGCCAHSQLVRLACDTKVFSEAVSPGLQNTAPGSAQLAFV